MIKVRKEVWVAARIFVGFIFAYAGLAKLIEPIENFRGVIAEYQVLPYSIIPFVAMVAPWMELISGVFMLVGFAPRLTSVMTALLSLSFLIILGASNVLLESGGKDCGCFGQSGPIHFTVRQIFMIDFMNFLISLKVFSLKDYPASLDQWLQNKNN